MSQPKLAGLHSGIAKSLQPSDVGQKVTTKSHEVSPEAHQNYLPRSQSYKPRREIYICRREYIHFPPRNVYLPPRFITSAPAQKTCKARLETSEQGKKVWQPAETRAGETCGTHTGLAQKRARLIKTESDLHRLDAGRRCNISGYADVLAKLIAISASPLAGLCTIQYYIYAHARRIIRPIVR